MSKYPTNDFHLSQRTFTFPIVIGYAGLRQYSVAPHHHHFYEISIYMQGSACEVVNNQMIQAMRGTVICKQPHRIHETRYEKGQSYSKYNLMFDMDILLESKMDAVLRRFYNFGSDAGKPPVFQLNEEQSVIMERLLREINRDYESDDPFRQSYIRSKLVEILVHITRCQSRIRGLSETVGPARLAQVKPNPNKITQVLQYINSHYLTDMSLGGISEKFAVSTPYVSKMIKKITGMNFTDYVHELRIDMACSLLVSTHMSILDVSGESGYGSFKTFSRVFLMKKGMTPLKYRAQYSDPVTRN